MNDYYDDEGCLVCGTCNRRKTTNLPFLAGMGHDEFTPCLCLCQEEAISAAESKAKQEKLDADSDKKRCESLLSPAMVKNVFAVDDGRTPALKRRMERYAETFHDRLAEGSGLLLYGESGNSKTFYECCIANELMSQGYSVKMISIPDLVGDKERNGYDRDVFGELSEPDLLIVDDLGVERATGYMVEQVFVAIDTRYRACKPMIVSTNLDLRTIRGMTDASSRRIWDRLFEVCYPVKFEGNNRRVGGQKLQQLAADLEV